MNRIIILQEFEKMFPMTKVFDIGGNDMYIYDGHYPDKCVSNN